MIFLFFMITTSPFYEANFSSLPMRSMSLFSNPAGIGIQPGAEYILTCHPARIMTGISVGNLGLGMTKMDSIAYYEAGLGVKLPGAFSLGYAYQFVSPNHIFGLIARPSQYLSLGFRTTIGDRNHILAGIGLRPFREYLTLSADLEYEGIDSIFNYYYGGIIQPVQGVKLNFYTDKDLNWNAGLEFTLGKIKFAGVYSRIAKKFSGGIILSAQDYKTFLPRCKKITKLTIAGSYPELQRKSFLGIPLSTKQGFTKLLNDLKSLVNRQDVNALLVELNDHSLGPGQLEELKNILTELKKTGKKIIFFADNYPSILTYELACIGDEIILSPSGSVIIPGLAMRRVYLKGTLDKLGIATDIVSVGKYKSATEIFSRTDMSAAEREQLEKILDDSYYPILANIAQARKKTKEEVEKIINEVGYLNSDDARSCGLIDTAIYRFEMKDYLKKKYGKMAIVNFENLIDETIVDETWQNKKPKIALVIAEGSIVSGEGRPNFFESALIGGDKYARIFEQISKDENIKAVIFRINSGGGDAFASEEIVYALKRCAEEKPVIVTMGDVAGSGGYYIACLADKIYADDRTITGSIGVLNVRLINKGLYDKLGISWDYVKRGEHIDALWDLRHLTDEELKKEEKEVKWWYDKFTNRVAQGRNMTQAKVDSSGQGRIYSGKHAKELNLIDKTGGFLQALEAAKERAGIIGDVEIVVYPKSFGFSFFDDNRQNRVLYLMPGWKLR